jgi:Mrp family chromosome partitioning ATPase
MKSSGIEELKSVLRRSATLIVGVIVLGVLALTVIRQLAGPEYQAGARVLLNSSDLSSAILGINPVYQDPNRKDQAEQNLVNSPQLYEYAANSVAGRAGTATELMNNTTASVANNVVDFTAKTSEAARSQLMVNTVATAYPRWRAQVSSQAVASAIAQVRDEIQRFGNTPDRAKQLQQLQTVRSLSAGETLFVEQATKATKTAPHPAKDALLGGVIGLVIALLIVGARELFDTTVRSEADVEDALEAPVLATIDSLPRRLRTSVLDAAGGRFNDEYDLLAANISQTFDGHEGVVQLAVTSALPGEGKTTTASNLAAALSRRGANVVLADFDLRKPSVSKFVGIPPGAAGVAELLAGSADVRSVLWQVNSNGEGPRVEAAGRVTGASSRRRKTAALAEDVERSADGSLLVMPGGVARKEKAPRFARLPSLLDRLPTEADFIVIDTPPALLVSGMAELAQTVDAVIVVVRHGFVHRRRLRTLGRQAGSWRARLLGAVLNDSPGESSYAGYYSG